MARLNINLVIGLILLIAGWIVLIIELYDLSEALFVGAVIFIIIFTIEKYIKEK